MSEEARQPGDRIDGSIGDVNDGSQVAIGTHILQVRAEAGSSVVVEGWRTQAEERGVHAPPAGRHRLYGRDTDLKQITQSLRERGTVLLFGTGGMGKTALALKAAESLHAEKTFAHGVLWMGPVGSSDLSSLCDAIARDLGDEKVLGLSAQEKLHGLMQLLARHNLLLVLDDIHTSETAHTFLTRCRPARLPVLVTSRTRMSGFDLRQQVDELDRDAAEALFQDEAGLDEAELQETTETVTNICQLLEDHPLALVIAAGKVSTEGISLESLSRRLSSEKERLSFLRLGEDKDRNVYASVALSYDSLDERQRLIFTRLAACLGETTGLELLAEICGLTESTCEDVVGELVRRSLVEREGDRVGLHQLVRDFGRFVLKEELQEVQDRVAGMCLQYAGQHSPALPEHHDRLEAELDNLLGSVAYARKREDWSVVLRLADILVSGETLYTRGYWGEASRLGRLGMAAAEAVGDEAALARFGHNTGILAQEQGNSDEARELYEEVLHSFRELSDQGGIAITLHNLGMIAQFQGNSDEAREQYQQSLEIDRRLGNQGGVANSLHQLGMIAQEQGEYEEAKKLYERALEIFEHLRSPSAEIARSNLVSLEQKRGKPGLLKRILGRGT